MKVVLRTDEYTIYMKRNGRHGVQAAGRRWINGDEKVAILLEHKLVKAPPPKAEPEPEEAAAEEAADSGEEAAEEAAEE